MPKMPARRRVTLPRMHPWWTTILACGAAAICLVLLIPIMLSYASGQPVVTLAVSNGGTSTDDARSIARATDGSVYISGTYRGDATFGSITVSGHATSPNAYIAKYSADGTALWVRTAPSDGVSASGNLAWWVGVDPSGNAFMSGTYNGTASFSGTEVTSNGGGDLFIAKYNSDGDLQWVRVGGSSSNEAYGSLYIDTDGTAYIAAGCHSGTAGSTFSGTTIHDEVGNAGRDWCIIAYNAAGNLVRATMLGGITDQDDEPFGGIVKAVDGGWFVAGDICCTAGNTGSMDGTPITVAVGGGNDIAVAKFDENFDLVWFDTVGASGSETPTGLISVDGDVYVTSNSSNNISYGEAGTVSTAGGGDVFLARYDGDDGTVLWAKNAGGTGTETGQDMTTDGTNVYVTGTFAPPATIFGGPTITGSSTRYGFIAKVSSAGTTEWALPVSGTGSSSTTRGCSYQNGLWCAGIVQGTGTFSSFSLTSSGGSTDSFLIAIAEVTGMTKPQATRVGTIRLEKTGTDYTVWSPDGDKLEEVKIKDPSCRKVEYVSGDENENEVIDAKERWAFRCPKPLDRSGTAVVYVRSNGFLVSAVASE